jgi:hypothetical protein
VRASPWPPISRPGRPASNDTERRGSVRGAARWRRSPAPFRLPVRAPPLRAFDFYGTAYPNQQETTQIRTALRRRARPRRVDAGPRMAPFSTTRSGPTILLQNLTGTATLGGRSRRAKTWRERPTCRVRLQSIGSTFLGCTPDALVEFGRPFDTAVPAELARRPSDDYSDFGWHLAVGRRSGAVGCFRLRASAGTASAFRRIRSSLPRPQNIGNPALTPEKAGTSRQEPRDPGRFTFDAAGFWRHGTDLIDFVRLGPCAVGRLEHPTADTWVWRPSSHGREEDDFPRAALQAAYFADLAALGRGGDHGGSTSDLLHVKWDLMAGECSRSRSLR